jgi:adenine phosphoribosyltransferase
VHADAVAQVERVLLVDDLIATGGTAEAAVKLSRAFKAEVVNCRFAVGLPGLEGRNDEAL